LLAKVNALFPISNGPGKQATTCWAQDVRTWADGKHSVPELTSWWLDHLKVPASERGKLRGGETHEYNPDWELAP
jgi:hypothetical protein